MEAWQLALLAWYGLNLLIGLVAGGVALAKPAEAAKMCYQQLAPEGGPAVCPRDFTAFTMPEPDDHFMVRR